VSIFNLERSLLIAAWLACLLGCGGAKKSKIADDSTTPVRVTHAVVVDVPWDTSARDDVNSAILRVAIIDNGVDGVLVPYLYGYPLYAENNAARALFKLRQDNWTGAEPEEFEDESGVRHYREKLVELGCIIEGIRESETRLVPLSIVCQLPAPKKLGGAKRPAVGGVRTGAKAEEIIREPSIRKAFLGGWHLTSDDFDTGNGIGYFNTAHGLLAFGFTTGRLDRIAYYFSPSEKRWQEPTLWIKP
jgi:hypothetical protein